MAPTPAGLFLLAAPPPGARLSESGALSPIGSASHWTHAAGGNRRSSSRDRSTTHVHSCTASQWPWMWILLPEQLWTNGYKSTAPRCVQQLLKRIGRSSERVLFALRGTRHDHDLGSAMLQRCCSPAWLQRRRAGTGGRTAHQVAPRCLRGSPPSNRSAGCRPSSRHTPALCLPPPAAAPLRSSQLA